MKKLNKIMAGVMAVSLCMAGNGVFSQNGFISDISIKASAAESGSCGDNATYTLDDEGTLIISGTGEMNYGDFPPWHWTSDTVKNVIIADGITSIGKSAFSGKEITSITIPDSVTIIQDWAFWGCTNLTSVTMSNNVTKIDEFAFCSCRNLKEIIIPASVTSIGNAAFEDTGLTKITILNPECAVDNDERSLLNDHQTINDGATIYGYENSTAQAYAKKYKLDFVVLEEPTKTIGGTCGENLTWLLDGEGTLTISGTGDMNDYDIYKTPWYPKQMSIKKVIIEDGVTHIGSSALYFCLYLASVTIPDSVTSIGDSAFWGCQNLTSVKLSDNLTSIGYDTFYDCKSLTSVTIPESVTSIYDNAFMGCESLTSVTIPDNVKSIGEYAFDCKALKEITVLNPECEIYDDRKTIGSFATIYGYENSTAQEYAEKYYREFVSLGEPPVIELESGDVNGDNLIDTVDATAVSIEYALLATGGESKLSDEQKKAADVNGDGFIDAVDSTYILRYYAKVSAGQDIDFEEFVKNN